MTSLVVITIITLAIVSSIVLGLLIFAYRVILKSARKLAKAGELDDEFTKEAEKSKKKSYKVLGIIIQVISGAICLGLVSIALVSGIYRIQGRQFVANNHVSFAIATDSMEGYYDDEYKEKLITLYSVKYSVDENTAASKIKKDQFDVGDFVQFNVVKNDEELTLYDVYGYKNKKGNIITHRYVGVDEDGTLIFRGDNAPGEDIAVKREQVLYHYQGHNTKAFGLVILFFGSGYGIYAIGAVIAVYVISDIAIYKWEKIKNARLEQLGYPVKKSKKEEKNAKA